MTIYIHNSYLCAPKQTSLCLFSYVLLNSYTGKLASLSSPMHSLFPASSAILYTSGADCNSCLYIPNDGSSLTMGTPYYVRVTAYNAMGSSAIGSSSGDDSEVVTAVPNQVKQLNLLRTPPLFFRGKQSKIEWDDSSRSKGVNILP